MKHIGWIGTGKRGRLRRVEGRIKRALFIRPKESGRARQRPAMSNESVTDNIGQNRPVVKREG